MLFCSSQFVDISGVAMHREHREFAKDLGMLIVSMTPVSWVISIAHFSYKWGHKRKAPHRVAKRIKVLNRKRNLKMKRSVILNKLRLTTFDLALVKHKVKQTPQKIGSWFRWNVIYPRTN